MLPENWSCRTPLHGLEVILIQDGGHYCNLVILLLLISSRSEQLCKTEGCSLKTGGGYFKYNMSSAAA